MLNLIWVQLEAYGALNEEKNSILQEALDKSNFSTINLSQAICAAPSTVMTTMGLLTGVSPVMLAKDHIPKRLQIPDDWQANGFQTITNFLEEQDYDVTGINAVYDAPKCLPMFKDTHAGVTPDMGKKEGYNFWEAWCIVERLKNIKASLSERQKAFFFHLIDADILPDLLDELATIGLNQANTVMVLIGDHGWPIKFLKKEPPLFHDLHQEENNIRVACHISYPDCESKEYSHFCSSLDLAPTALELMGFTPKEALPKAEGLSLVNHLKDNSPTADRIIRLDNRYIAQRRNKVITLVTSTLRYTFRYETNWDKQPYYKYEFEEIPEREELYLRSDIDEKSNLINSTNFSEDIEIFREYLAKTESQIIQHFYGDNLFEHYLLKDKIFTQNKEEEQRLHSSTRIQKSLLSLLKKYLDEKQISKVALYGAGNHTRSLLSLNILNSYVCCIIDDNPLVETIENIPVFKTDCSQSKDFKALVLSSDYFEPQLQEKAESWLPENLEIIALYQKFGKSLPHYLINYPKAEYKEILDFTTEVLQPQTNLILSETKDASDNLKGTVLSGSYQQVKEKLPKTKFEFILYTEKSLVNYINWFTHADELLEPCGILLAQFTNDALSGDILEDILNLNDQLTVNFVKNDQSTIILACLWRFNS
jgi:hypothetical protein